MSAANTATRAESRTALSRSAVGWAVTAPIEAGPFGSAVEETAEEPAGALLDCLVTSRDHALRRLDEDVPVAAERHLDHLPGTAADQRGQAPGVHLDVHLHPGGPQHHRRGVGARRCPGDAARHGPAARGDGRPPGA